MASRVAVVTGASSGIGAATAVRLAAEGFDVVLGARRMELVQAVADECGGRALPLDVTDLDSITAFTSSIGACDVLVNNAGLASGLQPLTELEDERVEAMFRTNVLGLLRVTRALLPRLLESPVPHVVNLGSIAGFEVYRGGIGYTASKHGVRAITKTMRLELLGTRVRVTEVMPGMVKTEFSLVRFDGDHTKAEQVYEGLTPLSGEDVADCIAWAVTRPPHVNVDEIVVRPVAQATATEIARAGD